MKNDYAYLKRIFEVFIVNDLPTVKWKDLDSIKNENEHKFVHHIEIMIDQNLISPIWDDSPIKIRRRHSGYMYPQSPIRLTSMGHDFSSALVKDEIFSIIIKKLKNEGVSVVIDVAKRLAIKHANELLEL